MSKRGRKPGGRRSISVLIKELSSVIRVAREVRGWTQEEAAEQIDAERKTIWYWESGNAILPLAYVVRMTTDDGSEGSRRARMVLQDALGLGVDDPDPLTQDIDLRSALAKASDLQGWPKVREAIIAIAKAHTADE